MLKIEKLRISGLPTLSFEVASGECLAVEGPSGSGKTRLLRAIADLDPSDGYVSIEGLERHEMPGPAWRRLVRYVSAEPAWWADTPRPHFPSDADALQRVERMLPALGLTTGDLDQRLSGLSTGERLRLALIRALADEPTALLLDEPSAALDLESAGLVDELIRFQLQAGRYVVLVSHDARQIERLCHARLQLAVPARASMSEPVRPAVMAVAS